MGLFGRLIGLKDKPVMSAASQELQTQLYLVKDYVNKEFAQCTKAEKRDMSAMRCSELFKLAARELPFEHPYRTAWFAMAHAWFVTGMVLQRDRTKELPSQVQAQRWEVSLQDAQLAAWAATHRPFKDEFAVDAFSADLWKRMGHSEHDRPSPILIP
jgi:hypothetical protein